MQDGHVAAAEQANMQHFSWLVSVEASWFAAESWKHGTITLPLLSWAAAPHNSSKV
jgi:hypothetical protein